MTTLPHAPYIEAVMDALTTAGLEPVEYFTDDSDTRGSYCYLRAVLELDPSGTYSLDDDEIPAGTAWRHGPLLIWEWHTGIEAEDGEPDKGPYWQFAKRQADGSNEVPVVLPVYGYASPAAVVEATRHVIDRRIKVDPFEIGGIDWSGGIIGDSWDQADELNTACEAWGTKEASDA
ncbi:hypothetical protein [Streptomyces odontomachi]|uniref:hypothetical protein n=1 Tax=Streptomyces odontomachi TaxID=2944940 RepID=UPI00210B1FB3|nr:hypothetical protein [Streptomyces sp. ODS25]